MRTLRSAHALVTTLVLVTALFMAGGLFVSCGEAEKPAEQAKEAAPEPAVKEMAPIRMGVAGPHSGDLASYGIPTVKAAELVVEHVNAMGGICGRQVELIVEDDVCKPEVATNTATKLVGDDVDVVLGHICSGATKAALGIYKDSKIPVMSPSATNPALTQSGDYPNFFRTMPRHGWRWILH